LSEDFLDGAGRFLISKPAPIAIGTHRMANHNIAEAKFTKTWSLPEMYPNMMVDY
jgi:hypothetical protein